MFRIKKGEYKGFEMIKGGWEIFFVSLGFMIVAISCIDVCRFGNLSIAGAYLFLAWIVFAMVRSHEFKHHGVDRNEVSDKDKRKR